MPLIGTIPLPEFPLLLAPMEDVSDPPFRAVCRSHGADLTYSEFISSDSLIRGVLRSRRKLDIFEAERPVGIQLYGGDEESLAEAAAIVDATNPDLLDINFGCPVKGIVGRGAGAGVLRDPDRMVRLTEACVRSTRLPVTVKTRLGWDEDSRNIVEVAERLQDTGIRALTIHGRTRCQLYKGEADWELIGAVKNNPRMHIPIFGNGDIDGPQKALEYRNRYGVDGIMIGRAAIGYPWIFREIRHYLQTGRLLPAPDVAERVAVCRQHLAGALSWNGPVQGLYEMRGRYARYLKVNFALDHRSCHWQELGRSLAGTGKDSSAGLRLPALGDYVKRLVRLTEADAVLELLAEIEERFTGYPIDAQPIVLENYHTHCTL